MKSIEEPTDLVCSDCGPVPSGSDNTVDNTADSIAADEGFADKMSFLKEKLLERNLYVNLQKENIDDAKWILEIGTQIQKAFIEMEAIQNSFKDGKFSEETKAMFFEIATYKFLGLMAEIYYKRKQ